MERNRGGSCIERRVEHDVRTRPARRQGDSAGGDRRLHRQVARGGQRDPGGSAVERAADRQAACIDQAQTVRGGRAQGADRIGRTIQGHAVDRRDRQDSRRQGSGGLRNSVAGRQAENPVRSGLGQIAAELERLPRQIEAVARGERPHHVDGAAVLGGDAKFIRRAEPAQGYAEGHVLNDELADP